MTPQELFESWAPDASVWSPWAKPALFTSSLTAGTAPAGLDPAPVGPELEASLRSGIGTAVVVDLPGANSVGLGLALANRGWRPVPMFNTTVLLSSVVESAADALKALIRGATAVQACSLAVDAPPAFLLDSLRLRGTRPARPGDYDNRWIVFAQDFPSATLLRSHGITRVLLVRQDDAQRLKDIDDVLARWRRDGLEVLSLSLEGARQPAPYSPSRWWPVRLLFLFALVSLGLRRNSAGGFGSRVPEASTGSGFA